MQIPSQSENSLGNEAATTGRTGETRGIPNLAVVVEGHREAEVLARPYAVQRYREVKVAVENVHGFMIPGAVDTLGVALSRIGVMILSKEE